jgi:transposase-like protein
MASVLSEPYFHDEQAAFETLERIIWSDGKPHCPHCGVVGKAGKLENQRTKPSQKHPTGKPIFGLWKCYACRKKFTVRVGTVFEDSPIPLHIWFQAAHLLCSSKKGISSNQLSRVLGVTLKTAWFMSHRLRAAMADGNLPPIGGEGATVEIDETYIGGKASNRHKHQRGRGRGREFAKVPVFAPVERDGRARAFHVPEVSRHNLRMIVRKNVTSGTTIYSDDNHTTRFAAQGYPNDSVNHRDDEYVRGDVHSNTVESYFATLKRGIVGTYHHVSEQHLSRYLAEFSFRHSERKALGVDDTECATKALKGIIGKRLTYRRTDSERPEA